MEPKDPPVPGGSSEVVVSAATMRMLRPALTATMTRKQPPVLAGRD
jgi:hypothetical protein